MFSLKKIAFPAIFGFVLSFFISIISTHFDFGWSLLRGIIFAFIFAALFLLVDFVFSKFLDGPAGTDSSVSASRSQNQGLGNKVDIVIPGEDLTDDGHNLSFSVEKNKLSLADPEKDEVVLPGMQTNSDVEKNESVKEGAEVKKEAEKSPAPPSTSESKDKESFTPVQLGKTIPASGADQTASSPAKKKNSQKESEKEEIDSLPDIVGFVPEVGDSSSGESEVIEDSDFARSGDGEISSNTGTFKDGSKGSDHDAATMAKAIQTILKSSE